MNAASDTLRDSSTQGFDARLFVRLWQTMQSHRRLFVVALLLYLPLTAASLAQPRIIGGAIDDAINKLDSQRLMLYVAAFGVALLVQHLLQFVQLMLMQTMGQRVIRDLRHRVYGHMLKLDASFYDRSPVGRLLTRVTNDMEAIAELFASGAVTIVGDIVTLLGIVVVLFVWNAQLATMAMISIPLVLVVTGFIRQPARRVFRAIRTQTARLNAYLAEHLGGMAVVQVSGRVNSVKHDFEVESRTYRDLYTRSNIFDASLYASVEGIATATSAGIIWYGTLGAEADALSLGLVIGFVEYLNRFFIPLRDLSSKYTLVQSALTAAERAYGVLDQKPSVVEADSPLPVPPLQRELRFDHVSFGYRPDSLVLRDIDVTIHKGQRVAIVGRTGGGKTTLGRLLVRHYDVDVGQIMLDDVDIRDLSLSGLRSRFALVLQDVFLFSGTLRENLLFGAAQLDDKALLQAIERAGSTALIERIGGLDAPIVERGLNLSLGERQIIALLRTLVCSPDILILDEATASVDPSTERCLQDAIDAALEQRTALVIAHRLSTIQNCDRILVLHKGRLVEQGTHQQLMQTGSFYPKLYRLQYAAQNPGRSRQNNPKSESGSIE